MKLHPLFAYCEIPVFELLGHGIQTIVEVEVNEGGLAVFHFIEGSSLLELATQVGELVITPDLLKAQVPALLLVPREVKVQRARILTAILLGFTFLSL